MRTALLLLDVLGLTNVMKTPVLMLLLATFVLFAGCESKTDPLVGWKSIAPITCKNGEMSAIVDTLPGYKAITDDVQQFVNKLPISRTEFGPGEIIERRYCYWIQQITLLEDGTGRHAVKLDDAFDCDKLLERIKKWGIPKRSCTLRASIVTGQYSDGILVHNNVLRLACSLGCGLSFSFTKV